MSKSFTTYIRKFKNSFGGRPVEMTITNGRVRLALTLRYVDKYSGVFVSLDPDEARDLAADLIGRAIEIEENPL